MQGRGIGCRGKVLKVMLGASLIIFCPALSQLRAELIGGPAAGAGEIGSPQYHAELLQSAFVLAAEGVKPCVVRISADVRGARSEARSGGPLRAEVPARGSGSGFIIDRQGHILTSNHVVDPGGNIDVYTADLRRYKAKVVGRDAKTDLAVIKIEAAGELAEPVKFGDSDLVRPGQWSLAVGAPYGLEQSLTIGVISGLGRQEVGVAVFEDFIQTDAAINPGNSGGPLVNLRGEVIGVNAARLGKNGIGFAVPINMARQVAQQLIKDGRVIRGHLGVQIQALNYELSQKFGLDSPGGALVADVKVGGPAHRGGLKRGDVVVEFNGARLRNAKELKLKAAFSPPGAVADLKIIRDGKPLVLSLKVGELREEAVEPALEKNNSSYGLLAEPMSLREVDSAAEGGRALLVSSVERGSRAEMDGLKRGDIILEIERDRVDCMDHFSRAMERINKGENLLALVLREGSAFYTILRAP